MDATKAGACNMHQFDSDEEVKRVRLELLQWFDRHSRDLPWRNFKTQSLNQKAYSGKDYIIRYCYPPQDTLRAVWVSEVMLQQTRVAAVIENYKKWMKKWPTVEDLAKADLEFGKCGQEWDIIQDAENYMKLHRK
eukprot:m.106343 g.106343  ORF g.106343 m.106343 type:complete len:135 (+) comp37258_c0_seq21:31-435(+)